MVCICILSQHIIEDMLAGIDQCLQSPTNALHNTHMIDISVVITVGEIDVMISEKQADFAALPVTPYDSIL